MSRSIQSNSIISGSSGKKSKKPFVFVKEWNSDKRY
jgi:hypothetical protein